MGREATDREAAGGALYARAAGAAPPRFWAKTDVVKSAEKRMIRMERSI
jgi:hypothetical protein